MKNTVLKFLFLGVVALSMFSCTNTDDAYFEPANSAHGVIVNASPSSGDLYFFVESTQIGTAPFNYTDARGYYNFFPGDRTFSVRDDLGQTLATTQLTLAVGDFFSLFAVNTFNNLELVAYDDSAAKPEAGLVNVRFINLSPDAGSIDVYTDTNLNYASDLEFKQATQFISLNAGDYNFVFSNAADGTVLANKEVTLQSGRIYTIYSKGFTTPPAGSNDTFSGEVLLNY